MKFAIIALLLLAALCLFALSRRRAAENAARDAAAASARTRAARNKPVVPAVSNNLKGVTASQTITALKPVKPSARDDDEYVDDR